MTLSSFVEMAVMMAGTLVLEKGMANHSSIFAWRIPWTEQPDGLQSMESQRAGRD